MKVALVTGGTRGIGEAISTELKKNGFEVIATYNNNVSAAEEFQIKHGITTIKFDVSNYAECEIALKALIAEYGGIDVLVANAGTTSDASFDKMTLGQWKHVIDVNLNGVFNVIHPVWPEMIKKKFGRVIVISSINGQKGQYGQANYSAAKAADIGLVKALALEGARHGITVNAICPGYIATDMVKKLPSLVLDKITHQIPVKRLGSVEEIARCVVFLVADDSEFITGSTLSVNGGHYLS